MKQQSAKSKSSGYNLKKTGKQVTDNGNDLNNVKEPFSFRTYVAITALVVGFCILQFGFLKIILPEYNGIGYFFFLMVLTFVVVVLIDYLVNKNQS